MVKLTFVTVNMGNTDYKIVNDSQTKADLLYQITQQHPRIVLAVQEGTNHLTKALNQRIELSVCGKGRLDDHPIMNALTLGKGNESCDIYTSEYISACSFSDIYQGEQNSLLHPNWPRIATTAMISGEGLKPMQVTNFHCAPSGQEKLQLQQYKTLLKLIQKRTDSKEIPQIYMGLNNSKPGEANYEFLKEQMKQLEYIDLSFSGKTYRKDSEDLPVSSIWVPQELESNFETPEIMDMPGCKHNAVVTKMKIK